MSFRGFFLLFTALSLAEILLFVKIGEQIGSTWIILSVLATATIGVTVMRHQGFITVSRIQRQMSAGEMPALEMISGAFIIVSGAFLLTPGFLTDGLGFAFLVPGIRRALAAGLIKRGAFHVLHSTQTNVFEEMNLHAKEPSSHRFQSEERDTGDAIEGEFKRRDD